MAKEYFSTLNYSLGNEDTSLEVEICKQLRPRNIFSIAGCGSRALPLLACSPEKLFIGDVAKEQLHLSKLRLETIKRLDYQDFLLFWGFPPYGRYDYSEKRKGLFKTFEFSEDVRQYFEKIFTQVQWQSLLYEGRWEKTFNFFSKIVRRILGKDFDKIFHCKDLEKQRHFYKTNFPMRKWKFILFLLGNKSVFNTLLYKGDFIKKNVPDSHFNYYFNAFDHLFTNCKVNQSFFLNLCFYGEIAYPEGIPVEAEEEVFLNSKKSLATSEVIIEQANLLDLQASGIKYDFLSLSDVPSYFEGDAELNFMQKLLPSINSGGIVVLRNYLRIPDCDTTGYEVITEKFQELIHRERFQMYRIEIYQKN